MSTEAGIFVEGMAATWATDREGELFLPNAFDAGIAAYLKNPIVAYMHATKMADTVAGPSRYVQLGVTTALKREAEGLRWRAFLPRPTSPLLLDIYNMVKSGAMRALSVGGRFYKRGAKIERADLQEISIAAKGQNPEALIEVIELAAMAPVLTDCGDACALQVGSEGKTAAGAEDLASALALADFAAGLRGLRGSLAARRHAEVAQERQMLRRQIAGMRRWR